MENTLTKAKSQSTLIDIAKKKLELSYRQYNLYKIGILPSINLNASLPDFTRSISVVTQPDGQDIFTPRYQANSSMNLAINQKVPFLGGNISMSSSLNRIDIFGNNRRTSYASAPFNITYNQNLFANNQFYDERKLNVLLRMQAQTIYAQDLEDINTQATQFFFELYYAQERINVLRQSINDFAKLLVITKIRFDNRLISEADYLEAELRLNELKLDKLQATNALRLAERRFKLFLNIEDKEIVRTLFNGSELNFLADENEAVDRAVAVQKNANAASDSLQLIMEFKQNTIGKTFSANLSVSVGANSSSNSFQDIGSRLQQRQALSLSLQAPIFDWGKNKQSYNIALIQTKIQLERIIQERKNLVSDVIEMVSELGETQETIRLINASINLSAKQLRILNELYSSGLRDFSSISILYQKKNKYELDLIIKVGNFWSQYYNLRKVTLYDFITKEPIVFNGFTPSMSKK